MDLSDQVLAITNDELSRKYNISCLASNNMIEVRNLKKKFDHAIAVDDLSFKLEGQILVNGEDVTHQPLEQMRRRMGYVIQHTGLFPHYTVEENVAIVPTLLKWSPARIRTRVHELLEHTGLPPYPVP